MLSAAVMTSKELNDDTLSICGVCWGDAQLRPEVNIHTVWNANDQFSVFV